MIKTSFPQNDEWFKAIKDQYFTLVDKYDEKLETLAEQGSAKAGVGELKPDLAVEIKEAQELKVRQLLENQMVSESKAVKDSVTMVSNTVSALSVKSISSAQAQGYRNSLLDISSRLDVRMQKLAEEIIQISNDTDIPAFNDKFAEFVSLERARLDSIEMALVTKIKEDVVTVSARGSGHSGSSHTYLKKQDPPSFSGDILHFPEFKRRWGSQVHSEKLEEQAELDRLRDNIPESTKDAHASVWDAIDKFLDDAHEKATDTKVLLSNYAANSSNEAVRCKRCHEIGHRKFECPKNSASIAATRVNADDSDSDDNQGKRKEELTR